jgi:hypothetical protein
VMAMPQAASRGATRGSCPRTIEMGIAQGSGQVADDGPTAAGPETGGEADQVGLTRVHRFGREDQHLDGGVDPKAAAEALEGPHGGQTPTCLDLGDHGVGDPGAARGLADAEPEHLPAPAQFAAHRTGQGSRGGPRPRTDRPRRLWARGVSRHRRSRFTSPSNVRSHPGR